MEDPIISGVVTDVSEAKVTVLGVPDQPGVSAALFEPLAAANVNVDMIVQNTSTDGHTDISFTVPKADMGVVGGDRQPGGGRDRRDRRQPRRRHRQGVARRCRHEDVARHRRHDVPHARRRGRQHRDDLDVDDPHLGRRRHRATSSAPPAPCTRRSGSTADRRTRRRSPNASRRRRPVDTAGASVEPAGRLAQSPDGPSPPADSVEDGGARERAVRERRRGHPRDRLGVQQRDRLAADARRVRRHRRRRGAGLPRGVRAAHARRTTSARSSRSAAGSAA